MKNFSSRALFGLCVLLPGCAQAQKNGMVVPVVATISAPSLADFSKPFLFAYDSWDKVAKVSGGKLILSMPTGHGGLGDNFPTRNLSANKNDSPVLHLTIGPNNKEKILRFGLASTSGAFATWDYSLEGLPTGQEIVVAPVKGASLAQPTTVDEKKGKFDLTKIMQWQVQGDWGALPIDVVVSGVSLQAPNAATLADRAANDKVLAEKAAAERKANDALCAKYPRGAQSPVVENVALVKSDVLAITIRAGHVLPASVVPYVAQSGDVKTEKKDDKGRLSEITLTRGGKNLGWLIGVKRNYLNTREGFEGDPLLEFVADDTSNFSVVSKDDANFSMDVKPVKIGRKSTPTNWALDSTDMEMRHTIYLQMPKALSAGKSYVVDLGALNTRQKAVAFVDVAAKTRSEAVHVNQIGYRPDDPIKRAFVSCWMGSGGSLTLPSTLKFSLVNDKTGAIEYSNSSSDIWRADKVEKMYSDRNYSATDVARLDFSAFNKPGRYRVVVDGIGSSYPFDIAPDVWQKAFLVQMKGLYNQRSGEEIGAPYSTFKKPRDMNPIDAKTNGTRVTWSTYRAVEGGNENWDALAKGDTGQPAPGWGGYHDAGDWNPRRVTHMKVTMAQLELLDMFPQKFAALNLNIPKRANTPDILTEAIFEFECFHRLQKADGGVGLGLETQGDPFGGEVSWLQTMPIYAFAPDYFASWTYATVGARLARQLKPYDAKLAATYQKSAIDAFNWAEGDWARDKASGALAKRETWQATDARNFAALEIYRLTGEKKWHDLFLQNSVLTAAKPELATWAKAVQRDQAFIYATLPANLGDAVLKKKAVAAVSEMADRALTYAANNAWNLTSSEKGKPQFIGFYSTPDATDLIHAHFLTQNPKYLVGAVQSTQFQSGGNPSNLVYTSGLGANPVKHAFSLDARRTGQTVPVGLTVYGNVDLAKWGDQGWIIWPITYFLDKNTTPKPLDWPTNEAYWDLGGWPALNEFIVDSWSPNVSVWGYLAARK